MDDAQAFPQVVAAEYRFLERLNRYTLAAPALLREIEHHLKPQDGTVSVVDCGAGGGDIARHLMRLTQGKPWQCQCICTDSNPEALRLARQHSQTGTLRYQVADVTRLEEALGAKCVDVAHASLVLHHLDDAAVVTALRSMAAVARRLVVWNDLVRDRAGVFGAYVSTMFGSRELHNDAVISVRRSFTLYEARALAEAAGLQDIRVTRVRGARFVLSGVPGTEAHAPARRPMARARDLHFAYGTKRVLQGVNLVAHRGQAVRVCGPNGCGKSTLLACMAGALQPAAGDAWVDRSHAPPGYLPQDGGLFSALSGAANCELAAKVAGVPRRDRLRAVRAALERFGVAHISSIPVGVLSGGQRRRVSIACSLVHEPDVLILDEPDAGLDDTGRESLIQLARRALADGGLVLAASHTPGWMEAAAGRGSIVEVAL